MPSVTANPAAIAQCSHCRPPAYCSSNCTALELSERRAGRSLGAIGVGAALGGLAVIERNSSLGARARSSMGAVMSGLWLATPGLNSRIGQELNPDLFLMWCVCVWACPRWSQVWCGRENSSAVHGGNRCESTGVYVSSWFRIKNTHSHFLMWSFRSLPPSLAPELHRAAFARGRDGRP